MVPHVAAESVELLVLLACRRSPLHILTRNEDASEFSCRGRTAALFEAKLHQPVAFEHDKLFATHLAGAVGDTAHAQS